MSAHEVEGLRQAICCCDKSNASITAISVWDILTLFISNWNCPQLICRVVEFWRNCYGQSMRRTQVVGSNLTVCKPSSPAGAVRDLVAKGVVAAIPGVVRDSFCAVCCHFERESDVVAARWPLSSTPAATHLLSYSAGRFFYRPRC